MLHISFCARAAMLTVIDSASRRHTKMRDSGKEHVHPLTLCPNGDVAMTVAFAHKVGSSERDIVKRATENGSRSRRSAMSGAQRAPSLEDR